MAAHMQDQKIVALSNFQNSTVRIRCGLAVSLQGADICFIWAFRAPPLFSGYIPLEKVGLAGLLPISSSEAIYCGVYPAN